MNANYARPPKRTNRLPIIVALLGMLCAVGAVITLAGYYFLAPEETTTPLVLIREPAYGDSLALNEPVIVHALARDENNITRIEFWADGYLLETQTSSLPGGASPMPLVTGWQPTTPGQHTLIVRAFNTQEQSGDASIVVDVAEIPTEDADNDTIPDVADACPEEARPATASGCPDADMDGIADGEDACPDEIGAPEADGCPAVDADDRDGDGVADAEDACPDEPGLIPADGCPEHIAEAPAADAPADEAGADGAPPADDDAGDEGIPEGADPGLDIPDTDGDGMSDDADPCPFEAGTPEDGYCPPDDDLLPAPIPDGGSEGTVYSIEFDALSFEVDDDYTTVNCYVRAGDPLLGLEVELYEFEPSGERRWNLEEQLGGVNSRMIWITDDAAVPDDGQLTVQLDCFAFTSTPGGMTILGRSESSHGQEDWLGQVHTMNSDRGHFTAEYRLCSPSCDESAFQPPRIHTQYFWLGRQRLVWAWDGNPDDITGYMVYVDGARTDYTSNNYIEIDDYMPACGETHEIEVTAALVSPSEVIESPYSNTWRLEGEPCPRIARITFQQIRTYDLPIDTGFEYCETALGPLDGSLWVTGAETVSLPLNTGYRARWLGYLTGVCLHPNRTRSIAEIVATCNSLPYEGLGASHAEASLIHCPESNIVEIPLGPDDNLSFGATFSESDRGGAWQWIYNGSITLPPPPEGAVGGTYTISDGIGYMDLIVQVELLYVEP